MNKTNPIQHVLFVIMKISIAQILLMAFLTTLAAAEDINGQGILDKRISLAVHQMEIKDILKEIESKTGVAFTYSPKLIKRAGKMSMEVIDTKLGDILEKMFSPDIDYVIVDEEIVLKPKAESRAETPSNGELFIGVTGRITDEDGAAMPGVNILVQGTAIGTTSDINGNYSIEVADPNAVLVFSFIGYLTQEVAVNGKSVIDVAIAPDVKQLSEVVVVGYGTVKKSDLTGSVSSLKTADVNRAATTSFDQLIQGRMAGVTVTQGSAAPGGGMQIRVRGTNSINGGNDPLYVIDGIPIDNNNAAAAFNGRGYVDKGNTTINTLSSINPNDIESIEVLKDASATAIYGSRGANGVILVTTKKGKAGQSVVEFGASYGVQKVAKTYDMLNAEQFMRLNNEARANSVPAQPVLFNPDQVAYDTDWQTALLRTAPTQNYQLSFRGGDDKMTYAISGNYFSQDGIVRGSAIDRYNLRANVERKVAKKIKIGTNLTLARTNTNQVFSDNDNSLVTSALRMAPNQPVSYNGVYLNNENDAFNTALDLKLNQAGVSRVQSPLYYADAVTNKVFTNRLLGSVYGEYNIIKDLMFKTSLGADVLDTRGQYYEPINGTIRQAGGAALVNYSQIMNLLIENTLNYSRTLGDHSISSVIGQTAQKFQTDKLLVMAEGLNDNTKFYNFAGNTRLSNNMYPDGEIWTMLSYLARVNYGFKGKYLATASFRTDGSSRFGANHKYGYFPSFSAAWVLSKESFMQNIAFVSNLKLRAGYGQTGSQEIGLYNSLSTVGDTRAIFNNVLAAGKQPNRIPNPDLSWEKSKQTSVGIDFGILKERISVTADYYYKLTDALLYNREIPRTSGFSNSTQNIGSVSNRGWEVAINSENFNLNSFRWNTSFVLSHNENKIENIPGVIFAVQNDYLIQNGVALGSFYGYRTNGLFQQSDDIAASAQPNATPGERKYVDVVADNAINALDRVVLGSTMPAYTFGLTNTFSFKGFELYVFFRGVTGNYIYNRTRTGLESLDGRSNNTVNVVNRWTPENPGAEIPKAIQQGSKNSAYGSSVNDYFVEKGDYIRLQNITLSYTLPASISQRIKASNFRIYVSGENLWTSTKYTGLNPDITAVDNGAYPLAKIYTVGVNVGF